MDKRVGEEEKHKSKLKSVEMPNTSKGNKNEGPSTSTIEFVTGHSSQSLQQYAPLVDNVVANWTPESQLPASSRSSILSYLEDIPFLGYTSKLEELLSVPDEKDWPWVPIYQRKQLPRASYSIYRHDKGHLASATTNRSSKSITAPQTRRVQQVLVQKTFKCKMCSRPFKDAKSAYFHKYTHLSWEELEKRSIFHAKCKHCGKIFLNRKSFHRHVDAHEERTYHYCTICGKPFRTADSASGHTFVHMNQEEFAKARETWRHSCLVCDKRFRTSALLSRHARCHAEQTCLLDKGRFNKFNGQLNCLHSANLEPVKSCKECGKSFSGSNYLTPHAKIIRCKVKDVKCHKCDKKFNSNSAMVLHLNGVHLKVRHPCSQCSKSYTQKGNLGTHMKKSHPMERCENI